MKQGNSYNMNNSLKDGDNQMISSNKSSTNKLKTASGSNQLVITSMRHSYKASSGISQKGESKTIETDLPPQSFKLLSDKLRS